MTADEIAAADTGADTTPEPNPETGSAHPTERDAATAGRRAEPVWRIGRSGRLERVGREEPTDPGDDDDDVMALVNAIAPPPPGPIIINTAPVPKSVADTPAAGPAARTRRPLFARHDQADVPGAAEKARAGRSRPAKAAPAPQARSAGAAGAAGAAELGGIPETTGAGDPAVGVAAKRPRAGRDAAAERAAVATGAGGPGDGAAAEAAGGRGEQTGGSTTAHGGPTAEGTEGNGTAGAAGAGGPGDGAAVTVVGGVRVVAAAGKGGREGEGSGGGAGGADGAGAAGGDDAAAGSGGGGGGDGAGGGAGAAGGGGRRRIRRIVVWTAACLAVLLTAGIATAYGYYHSLRSGMVQHDLEAALDEGERPEKISDAVNILFMGSDGYEEGSTAYTTEFEGERSDSIMLAHISPDDRVSVISFPRDSLVNLPQCDPYGTAEGTYGYFGMINAAMYHGGPPCVVRTIESLTDVRIDHFVHLSFMSFRDVVDAIGGVDICIPEPMKDERSKLDIPAGQQTLTGDQALSFVRARYEIGDGGDIGRIDRQQMFMAALADQAMRGEVLSDPRKLHGMLTAVTTHSATDSRLTLDRMLSIAVSMSDVDLGSIEFHTVPWYQAPFDPNRILWYEDRAEELFAAVREDRPLPPLMAADEAAVPLEPPGASPSAVDVPSGAPSPEEHAARPGEGRDATSNPCTDGLGFGTGEESY
ncbi:LCP family protein [Nocardiopsis protaetiae]|uniref:LCP family protein n=1 Tax=Nocardiopsis protaetiae TaxID=3382270 RepID=UPI00387AF954